MEGGTNLSSKDQSAPFFISLHCCRLNLYSLTGKSNPLTFNPGSRLFRALFYCVGLAFDALQCNPHRTHPSKRAMNYGSDIVESHRLKSISSMHATMCVMHAHAYNEVACIHLLPKKPTTRVLPKNHLEAVLTKPSPHWVIAWNIAQLFFAIKGLRKSRSPYSASAEKL